MTNYNRHVEARNVLIYACEILKNDEYGLINLCMVWAWGAEPIFSEG